MSHILLDELVAQYIERYDSPEGFEETTYPDVYSHEVDGVTWFTDRYWVLPADMCSYGDGFHIREMPDSGAANMEKWVRELPTIELGLSTHVFAPTFAGVLTLAGLSARTATGKPWEVLVTSSGERVGLIMPYRRIQDGAPWSAIPASDHMLAMRERIKDSGLVHGWQCWSLAAHLTVQDS